ncbi:hypothetical protein [Croceiramulus getboli]|nr:hypothetical protein P8624_10330 [Flavobacteriaceae bacterium YJPT1-3]
MMKTNRISRVLILITPALLSAMLCGFLIYAISQKVNQQPDLLPVLEKLKYLAVFISCILCTGFVIYIISRISNLKYKGVSLSDEIDALTQQLHHFRSAVDVLVRSKLWVPGLKSYIDEEFGDLNYFMMKEFYKGRSKLAVEYMEENNRYGETEQLYLESKALLLDNPRKSDVTNYSSPRRFSLDILQKWMEHKCGSGLWYYFGYKYSNFKEELDVNRVYERHQEKILDYAVRMDAQRYQDMGFSEELLSRMGEQVSEIIIPKLYNLQKQTIQKLPPAVNFIYILFIVVVIFGLFLPIVSSLFFPAPVYSTIAIAVVVSVVAFIALSLYGFVTAEINQED